MSLGAARRLAIPVSALVVLAIVVLPSGGRHYRLRMPLPDADGLRVGSQVRVGDVPAGSVTSLTLGPRDEVVAQLDIGRELAPVGQNASVTVASLNLLGQKYVALDRGDTARPAPSGFTIPTGQITTSTDLDQVLGVLDADTRTRLAILINEAGYAMTGRRTDFSALLKQLPHTSIAVTKLLDAFVSDNRTLAHLVQNSDRFLAQIVPQDHSLSRLIDATGQAAVTVAARREQLRQTLARAPGALRSLRSFLDDLRATTVPLGPAARNISATAPRLSSALAQIEPFRQAAVPALAEAQAVAPLLTRLADHATPVIQRAGPTVASLAKLAVALAPVSHILDHSIDNLLAIVHNWSRAIEFRDAFSHLFNAQLVITPETLLSMISQLQRGQLAPNRSRSNRGTRRSRPLRSAPAQRSSSPQPTRRPPAEPPSPATSLPLPPAPSAGSPASSVSTLLNYLLQR